MKILITGAASGIGFLTALTLAQREHFVYLTCHSNKETIKLRKKVGNYKNIIVMKVDITDSADIKKILDLNIDVLLNHAGVCEGGSVVETDIDKMRYNYEVNVFSSFLLLQKVLQQMLKKGNGRIIVTSSLVALAPLPFTGIYSSTKSAISTIVSCLQKEIFLINKKVKVILIEPGMYHTGFNNVLMDSKYNKGKYFFNIKDKIYKYEHLFFKLGEKKKLDSIVIKIVRAIEDEKPKHVYRAPFIQKTLAKIYNIFK